MNFNVRISATRTGFEGKKKVVRIQGLNPLDAEPWSCGACQRTPHVNLARFLSGKMCQELRHYYAEFGRFQRIYSPLKISAFAPRGVAVQVVGIHMRT